MSEVRDCQHVVHLHAMSKVGFRVCRLEIWHFPVHITHRYAQDFLMIYYASRILACWSGCTFQKEVKTVVPHHVAFAR